MRFLIDNHQPKLLAQALDAGHEAAHLLSKLPGLAEDLAQGTLAVLDARRLRLRPLPMPGAIPMPFTDEAL